MAIGLFGALRNPILEREFVSICRTKRWFVLRSVFVGALVAASWLVLALTPEHESTAMLGKFYFGIVGFVMLMAVSLATPGLTIDAIVAERNQETLDVLLTTPLRALRILAGKLLSRIFLVVVVAAAAFPIVAVATLLGGVRGDQLLALAQLVLGAVLFLGGTTLVFSTFSRRLATAAVLSYVVPIAFVVLYPVAFFLFAGSAGRPGTEAFYYFACTHPAIAFGFLMEPIGRLHGPGIEPWTGWLITGAATAAVGLLVSARRLARERAGDVGGARRVKADRPETRRQTRRRRAMLRMVSPMAWKEARPGGSRSPVLARIVLVLMLGGGILSLVLAGYENDELDEAYTHVLIATAQSFLLLVLVTVNAAASVAVERQQRTLDLVHVTLVESREIVHSKILGAARSGALLAILPLLHLVLGIMVSELNPASLLVFAGMLALLVMLFATMGVSTSIRAPRPGKAVTRATSRLGLLVLGLPLLSVIFIAIDPGDAEDVAGFVVAGNPPTLLGLPTMWTTDPEVDDDATGFFLGCIFWPAVYGVWTAYRYRTLPALYDRLRREREDGA